MNIPYNGDTITLSIFPNGTIMFQGKETVTWVNNYIHNLSRDVENDIEDHKPNLDNPDESDISNNSVNLLGTCAICDEIDTNHMVECHKCFSKTHHHCDNLTEEVARKISKYYCKGCRFKYDALKVQNTSTPHSKTSNENLMKTSKLSLTDVTEHELSSSLSLSGELNVSSSDASYIPSSEDELSFNVSPSQDLD